MIGKLGDEQSEKGAGEGANAWREDLEGHAGQVHSQGGEDGVLLRLFEKLVRASAPSWNLAPGTDCISRIPRT